MEHVVLETKKDPLRYDTKWFMFEGVQIFDLVSRGFWSKAVLQYGFDTLNVK